MNSALSKFRTEIRHFFLVSLINLVFADIAIAWGVQYFVSAILGGTFDPVMPGFPVIPGVRMFTGAIAIISFSSRPCSSLSGSHWRACSHRIIS